VLNLKVPLELDPTVDSIAEESCKDKEEGQVKAEGAFFLVAEMVDFFSFSKLIHYVEIDLYFRHHSISHMRDMLTVHYNEVVDPGKVLVYEISGYVIAPFPFKRDPKLVNLCCQSLSLCTIHLLWSVHDQIEVLVLVHSNLNFWYL